MHVPGSGAQCDTSGLRSANAQIIRLRAARPASFKNPPHSKSELSVVGAAAGRTDDDEDAPTAADALEEQSVVAEKGVSKENEGDDGMVDVLKPVHSRKEKDTT